MTRQITSLSLVARITATLVFFLLELIASPVFSASSIKLAWIASPESDLMGYYVHMGTSQRSYHITKNAGLTPSYVFQNLPGGLTYYFTVTAYDLSGNISVPAEEVALTLPTHNTNPNPHKNQDLNGDGKADLVFRNTKTGEVVVWLLSGTNGGASGILGQLPTEWALRGTGDVNGDGKADLIWRNDTSGAVAVWLMNGFTITSTSFPGSAPTAWDIQASGDLNGDGKADLVWRNTLDGNTAIWLMNGSAIASSGFPATVLTTWQIAGADDVNGDGKTDVIWRNNSNGAVAVWLMNGATIAFTTFPGAASPDWEIQ